MKTLLERRRGESKFDRSRIHERKRNKIEVQNVNLFFTRTLQQFITKNQIVYVQNNRSKYALRLSFVWNRRLWNQRCALDFEFEGDATSQRTTALNLDKQTRPTYHSKINPSFSKRCHFCGIQYSNNISDKVRNHFCSMPGQRFKPPKL